MFVCLHVSVSHVHIRARNTKKTKVDRFISCITATRDYKTSVTAGRRPTRHPNANIKLRHVLSDASYSEQLSNVSVQRMLLLHRRKLHIHRQLGSTRQ